MSNRIVFGLVWTTASTIMRNVVLLLQIAILTRFLDKTDFGIIAVANLFVAFTTLFLDMGVSAGIIHKQNISKSEYSSLFWLNIFFGIGLTALLYFLAPFLTSQHHSEDLTKVVRLICLTILFSAIGTQQRTYCQKITFFKVMSIIETFSSIVTFIVALVTAIKGCGVYSLAYSTLAGSVVLNLTYFIVGIVNGSKITFHFSFRETLSFLKIGIYQVCSSIFDFFTRELDIMIVSSTLGLEFLGVYNIAKRVPTALFSFFQSVISRVFTPLLAEINRDRSRLKYSYMQMSKSLSCFSFPIYFLTAALAPSILFIMFGTEYLEGVPVMIVFCLRFAFSGVNGICGALQIATGRTDIGLRWTIYSILSTTCVYYLSAQLGITAFLIGMAILVILNVCVIWLMQFRSMTDIKWKEYISIYNIPLLICLLLSTIIYCIYHNPSALYAIIASIIYIVSYCLLIINSKDGNSIINIVNSLPIPIAVKSLLKRIKVLN